jgi:hypothetical protein
MTSRYLTGLGFLLFVVACSRSQADPPSSEPPVQVEVPVELPTTLPSTVVGDPTACTSDDDCVTNNGGCCDSWPVNRAHQVRYDGAFCEAVCNQRVTEVRCVDGHCAITEWEELQ